MPSRSSRGNEAEIKFSSPQMYQPSALPRDFNMRIIRAEHLGMCFGVRDAIALALKQSKTQPLTILGDLVHNETVLSELRAKGIKIAKEVGAVTTEAVMITAHGASEKALDRVRERGLDVTEATC